MNDAFSSFVYFPCILNSQWNVQKLIYRTELLSFIKKEENLTLSKNIKKYNRRKDIKYSILKLPNFKSLLLPFQKNKISTT